MDSYFDDLRLGVLEQFAQQWVNDFKDVQIISIELRHFSTPRRLSGRGGQAMLGLSYGFDWGEIFINYRYLSYDMDEGGLIEDLSFEGPGIGITGRF